MILLQGSGGPSGLEDNWARAFAALGIASFMVDRFTGRGISSTQDNQEQLSRLAHIGDAYRALEVLVQLPQAQALRRDYWRGCVGAMEYSLACPETTVTFVAVRYLLGIAITACVGCWLGPKTLQW
ncbi:MAG: DUF1109 family protein [Rhodocyclaceae bacterium]|nr:DUF1109 family protein [Rhodocyclaceae bacterium]